MNSAVWARARLVGGAAILVVLVWWLGTGPFLAGLRTISAVPLVIAAAIAVLTTVCAAWRWSLVARGLGVPVPLRTAIAAYYRSQFLNTALPGGVLGDVHRAIRHGREVGDVGKGLRAVGWERTAGQVVQVVIALVVLIVLPSPVRSFMPVVVAVVAAVVAAAIAATMLGRHRLGRGPARWIRTVRAARSDIRDGLLARTAWPGIVLASVVVVAGHTATFLLAAWTAGVTASTMTLLPLAMLVLLAMAVPANIGGWGPREGVSAWVFGLAGLGADRGVATATVYGVMVIVASLPGAVVLVVARRRGSLPADADVSTQAPPSTTPVSAGAESGVHG
ncbi:MAG: hypothetical protein JWN95_4076 [Frankiales bacterium]|nr:hypothetical protein [Frankiales bacterium]